MATTKRHLMGVFEEIDENQTLDLSDEASESYGNLVAPGLVASIHGKTGKKQALSSDKEDAVPEYPKSEPFDSRLLSRAESAIQLAFTKSLKTGWKVAFEEALKLESSRARVAFSKNISGSTLLEMILSTSESASKSIPAIIESAPDQPLVLVPNPKNKELAKKIEKLKSLLESYEKECNQWDELDNSIQAISSAPAPQEIEIMIPESDVDLMEKLADLSSVPSSVLTTLRDARKQLERLSKAVIDSEQQMASLVALRAEQVFGPEVNDPKPVLEEMANADTTIIE